jgi:hypothetical protein
LIQLSVVRQKCCTIGCPGAASVVVVTSQSPGRSGNPCCATAIPAATKARTPATIHQTRVEGKLNRPSRRQDQHPPQASLRLFLRVRRTERHHHDRRSDASCPASCLTVLCSARMREPLPHGRGSDRGFERHRGRSCMAPVEFRPPRSAGGQAAPLGPTLAGAAARSYPAVC